VEKILVGLKRVVDSNIRVRVKSDGSGVETEGVKMSINPFDEIALEEALRIRERGDASEVIVVSIGGTETQQQLRTGLAMGADRAIQVEIDHAADPLTCARILLALVNKENPGLVMLGKQAIDNDNNQTGQMLAELLGVGQACFASKVELADDGGKATVTREVDGGFDVVEVDLPAVITADLRLNEPRYASLPGIMKAKKKPIKEVTLDSLGVDTNRKVVWHTFSEPPVRQAGIMVPDVPTLVAKLRDEAKVI